MSFHAIHAILLPYIIIRRKGFRILWSSKRMYCGFWTRIKQNIFHIFMKVMGQSAGRKSQKVSENHAASFIKHLSLWENRKKLRLCNPCVQRVRSQKGSSRRRREKHSYDSAEGIISSNRICSRRLFPNRDEKTISYVFTYYRKRATEYYVQRR